MSRREPEEFLPRLLEFDTSNTKPEKCYHILYRVDGDVEADFKKGITTDEEMHLQVLGDCMANANSKFITNTTEKWKGIYTTGYTEFLVREHPGHYGGGFVRSSRGYWYDRNLRDALIAAGYEKAK